MYLSDFLFYFFFYFSLKLPIRVFHITWFRAVVFVLYQVMLASASSSNTDSINGFQSSAVLILSAPFPICNLSVSVIELGVDILQNDANVFLDENFESLIEFSHTSRISVLATRFPHSSGNSRRTQSSCCFFFVWFILQLLHLRS